MTKGKNWHEEHKETLAFGQRLADSVANGMGSWRFIIIQSVIVAIWMILNVAGFCYHWDVYPFILLNLLFSTQAAYAAHDQIDFHPGARSLVEQIDHLRIDQAIDLGPDLRWTTLFGMLNFVFDQLNDRLAQIDGIGRSQAGDNVFVELGMEFPEFRQS